MDSRTQISKTSIILTDADKWDDWLGNIRRIALSADIWEHINPNVNEVIPLTKPPFPTYSQLKDIDDQFVIEYQPVAAFPADSHAPKPDSHGTIERWHQRMGHLHEEAVKKLPQAVYGVILDQSKPLGICEVCRTS